MKTATLLSVGLGLLAGYLYGDELRRRKNAEANADDLTKLLEKASFKTPPPEAQLKKMATSSTTPTSRSPLSQKPSKNPPPKPHKINGRIHTIRPFQKVWVVKQIKTLSASLRERPTNCRN